MKVWRCEDDKQIGPYWTKSLSERPPWMNDHNSCDNHPSPWSDGISLKDHHVCGFDSFESLDAWFTEENRQALRTMGYKLYVMDVPEMDVVKGGKQVVFPRDRVLATEEELR